MLFPQSFFFCFAFCFVVCWHAHSVPVLCVLWSGVHNICQPCRARVVIDARVSTRLDSNPMHALTPNVPTNLQLTNARALISRLVFARLITSTRSNIFTLTMFAYLYLPSPLFLFLSGPAAPSTLVLYPVALIGVQSTCPLSFYIWAPCWHFIISLARDHFHNESCLPLCQFEHFKT